MTTYRNNDTRKLERIAQHLADEGFEVRITYIADECYFQYGPDYITTNASNFDVLNAYRAAA